MLKILLLTALTQACRGDIQQSDLASQIRNTRELLVLYQKKLQMLMQIYQNNYPNIPLEQGPASNSTLILKKKTRISERLVQLKHFSSRVHYLPKKYLLCNNQILDIQAYTEVAQFYGEVLLVENQKITTSVGGKLGMSVLNHKEGGLRKEEYLVGTTVEEMKSVWQRNFNIKDAEDLFIQWNQQTIYLRGRETQTVTLQEHEQLLEVFSLNQYKIVFVTSHRIGTINSRALQMGDSIAIPNITRQHQHEEVLIVAACQVDSGTFLLLNSGELAKYFNDRIVMVQNLSTIQELSLYPFSVTLQVVSGYLFVVDKQTLLMKVFSPEGGRFASKMTVNLPKQTPGSKYYHIYKLDDSIRLLISSAVESVIYEVLMPIPQEHSYSPSYLKVVGVIAVIGCFIYFKFTRKESEGVDRPDRQGGGQRRVPFRESSGVEEVLKRKKGEGMMKEKSH